MATKELLERFLQSPPVFAVETAVEIAEDFIELPRVSNIAADLSITLGERFCRCVSSFVKLQSRDRTELEVSQTMLVFGAAVGRDNSSVCPPASRDTSDSRPESREMLLGLELVVSVSEDKDRGSLDNDKLLGDLNPEQWLAARGEQPAVAITSAFCRRRSSSVEAKPRSASKSLLICACHVVVIVESLVASNPEQHYTK